MKQRYAVLRDAERIPPRGARRGGASQPTTGVESVPTPELTPAGGVEDTSVALETHTLEPAQARRLASDGLDVIGAMPVALLEPTAVVPLVAAHPPGPTWGVRAVGADTSPFDGRGVVVAVLDTGIDANHPAFAGMSLEQRNFTGDTPEDTHGHGTHCAATIFGRDVDSVRIGIARGVQRALIGKVIGSGGNTVDIADAINWAIESGAHVISMSLGVDFPGHVRDLIASRGLPAAQATSLALDGFLGNLRLFDHLAGAVKARSLVGQPPVLLVAAAGNESRRPPAAKPNYEISLGVPAVSDGFIAVAAVGQPGAGAQGLVLAEFSNTGVRLSGPGVGVVSARLGGGLVSMNGTSMATPHVAGVAALWAQRLIQEGDFRRQRWIDELDRSASTQTLAPGFDRLDVGLGMVTAPQD